MRTNIATVSKVTEAELCRWVGTALPGHRLVYHRGVLCRDRETTAPGLNDREANELRRVARRALSLAKDGFAHLVQHRHGPDDYSYLLIARPKPQTNRGLLLTLVAERPVRDF
jgi:hypothetical protein